MKCAPEQSVKCLNKREKGNYEKGRETERGRGRETERDRERDRQGERGEKYVLKKDEQEGLVTEMLSCLGFIKLKPKIT